ncbi:S8 family serine peptidase [bacterium]|nr:S8 family serine peptidase [bacterium]
MLLILLLLGSCGGSDSRLPAAELSGDGSAAAPAGLEQDPGMLPIPGVPGLVGGLRSFEDPEALQPLPRRTAQAGLDFAANRVVVVWENQPDPVIQQRYMGGGAQADLKRATDNHPLVDHPFYRRVSHNFAAAYGLSEFSRVFYRDVNFTAFEVPGITEVSQLDALMQRLLSENPGLVREVTYDFFVEACSPEQPDSVLLDPAEATTEARRGLRPGLPEALRRVSAAPNDPMHLNIDGPGGGTWANWRLGAVDGQAWNSTTGSAQIVVAVVDTGTRYTHEDLVDNCIEPAAEFPYNQPGILTDVINKDNDPNDDHNHGTWCAGNIGATGNNGLGLSGINQTVRILPVKVLSAGGSGSETQVAEGMLLADFLGAQVISMSLGGDYPDRIMQLAAQQLDQDGRLLVVAAGNSNDSAPIYPGAYPYALCVGATTLVNDSNSEDFSLNAEGEIPTDERFDARATFSNYGPWVDVAAPGVRVRSTDRASDSAYRASVAGTSFACPYTAGCAALLWAHMGPEYSHHEVRGMLMAGTTVMDHLNTGASPDGFIDDTTNGPVRFVNVWNSIQLFDAGPYEAPDVSWASPAEGSSVSGVTNLQVQVSGGDGNVIKVEFDTPTRHLGTTLAESGGFWQVPWDSSFDFNREMTITATVHDDVGHIISLPLTVTPDNARITPPWLEAFDGVALDGIQGGWFRTDFNGDPASTQWGADDSQFASAAPAMHSNGTAANYAANSNDWLYAPVIDLSGVATAELSFQRRYERGSGDRFQFFATDDDETFSGASFTSSGVQDWAEFSYDLTPFCGGELRLMWQLTANGSGQATGMWIDDISITVPTGTPPTVSIDSPLPGESVSGIVEVQLTLSDDTTAVELYANPVDAAPLFVDELPDNDPDNPTKTLSLSWDSRQAATGPVRLLARAYDDESDNGGLDDLAANAVVELLAANPVLGVGWLEDFEAVTDLGGLLPEGPDGVWFRSGSDDVRWRSGTHDPWQGLAHAYMGPEGGGSYGNNELERLYSPLIDLGGSAAPFLRLHHSLDVEDGTGDKALLYIVRYDGFGELELNLFEQRSDSSGYQPLLFDLSGFRDTPFRLMFLFDSNNNGQAGTGWSLDDLELLDASPFIVSLGLARGYPGQSVTLNGMNFGNLQEDGTVSFRRLGGGSTEAVVSAWSKTQISVVVPDDADSGDVYVTVLGRESNARHFSVLLDPTALTGIGQFAIDN